MIESLLLPSQESLIARLAHNIRYAGQLQLLCGEAGAGKTFLLRRLNRSLEDSAVVLLSCPSHADDAEIRRKILLPLLSEPVFDDEISLADSLTAFSASLQSPVTILIDDAQRLSPALWAELIALSQMIVAGRQISVVAGVIPDFERQLAESLPESYQSLLTTLYLEPLIQQDQDALYYALLSRSDGFEARQVAKPDFSGRTVYPRDIVSVFAASGDEQAAKVIKPSNLKALLLALPVIAAVLLLSRFYQTGIISDLSEDNSEHTETAEPALKSELQLPVKDAARVFNSPEDEKSDPVVSESEPESAKPKVLTSENEAETEGAEPLIAPKAARRENQPVQSGALKPQARLRHQFTQEPQAKTQAAGGAEREAVSAEPDIASPSSKIAVKAKTPEKPTAGSQRPEPENYTLQIAAVSKKRSLNKLLKQLKGREGVRVGKNNKRWVVVVGVFEDYRQAEAYEKTLLQQTALPKPWIRQWKALNNVELRNIDKISEN